MTTQFVCGSSPQAQKSPDSSTHMACFALHFRPMDTLYSAVAATKATTTTTARRSRNGTYRSRSSQQCEVILWSTRRFRWLHPTLFPSAYKLTHPFQAGPSLGKQRYMNGFFDPEIDGQRRNNSLNHRRIIHSTSPRANADPPSSSRLHGVRTFFSGVRPSSDKGKQKARQPKQKAQEVIDVPLGQATYQDVVGVDDGIRPYVLFFCLSWFQKKKKKPDPPRPVYDDELEDDESEEGVLNIPMPTACIPAQQQDIELNPMTRQAQPEAGPSHIFTPHSSLLHIVYFMETLQPSKGLNFDVRVGFRSVLLGKLVWHESGQCRVYPLPLTLDGEVEARCTRELDFCWFWSWFCFWY
ncbi:hypothetical protein EDB19DRAFT_2026253 [Suillus lakei]|nr:hypothetical protein EDB19DRAFT_2026253 [Suillus lakei]